METVIAFRFEGEWGWAQRDAFVADVQNLCRTRELPQPIVTFGDPPTAALVPDVLTIQNLIAASEVGNGN